MLCLSSINIKKRRAVVIAAFVLTFIIGTAGQGRAEDEVNQQSGGPITLSSIGMELDRLRILPASSKQERLASLETALNELLDKGIPSEDKAAALFLSAEIQYEFGRYRQAAELFDKAKKKDKQRYHTDDAEFLAIISMEADGRDIEAAKEWKNWIKKYDDSPILPEALLAKSWNAIRRDSLREAKETLDHLEVNHSFMMGDDRVRLALATIAYLGGQPEQAETIIGDISGNAAATYLKGLCCQAQGQMLKAASFYQKVFERFPESTVRDTAILAKANIFLLSKAYKSAVEEFDRVIERATNENVRAEADLRKAACLFLDGDAERGAASLREVVQNYTGTTFAARAQLLLGEVLAGRSMYEEAILEFNNVLTDYFEHDLAASAQYRVGRCLDALDRQNEATSAYQLVVSGYPMAPQAPAAAYLAGAGLLAQNRPQAAIPYFQLVLDRYANDDQRQVIAFSSPEHQELVEASLCLLEYSYHLLGDTGQLSGVPHLMLQKMPPSNSQWRAYALLIDADALAAQARYDESQSVLQTLIREFPEHEIGISANRLLAWNYAQQGEEGLAIETEEKMLARYSTRKDSDHLSLAYLHKAHILFNKKEYKEAAATYDEFLQRFPSHPRQLLALYQSGLSYYRLQQNGDAVDRWEQLVETDPGAEIAERAWVRAGDLYFQAEHYEDAKRCYSGLLDNFSHSRAAALGMLRLAQCEFNAGQDREALKLYSVVIDRFPGTGIAREAKRGMENALYRLGQRSDGSELLAELVQQYPNSSFAADAQFEIAMRHYQAERYSEAADDFRRVVSQFPGYSAGDQAHYLMAESSAKAGLKEDAKIAYEQFLMFFPESDLRTTVRFRLGSCRFANEEYMRAAVDFTTVIDESDSDELKQASLFNLALCKKMLGDAEAAQSALENYRSTSPASDERRAEVAYQLGDIKEKAGDWEAAAKEYELALASNPSGDLHLEIYYRLGLCREQLGDVDGAIKIYSEAIASQSKSDAFRLSSVARCATLYEEKGVYKKAISAYQDLVRNAEDPELVVAAKERVSQLEAIGK
jgi:TolA-binding protein